ncbi:hypothetical protein FACS189446_6350 [Bacteroidia bacterium]|nr:hypothetical protein FACS189446_6350 [Bacteroidia bacterium]
MKKVFLSLMALVLMGISAYSQTVEENPQWIFFKEVIPKQKSITISGSDWEMTINDKYKVTFSGNYRSSDNQYEDMYNSQYSESATFRGVGFVIWDNDKMKIKLTVYTSGNYNSHSEGYKYETKVSGGRVALNVASALFGNGQQVATTSTEKVLDYTRNDYASGSNNISNTYSFQYNSDGTLYLSGNDINLTMTGSTTRNVSMKLSGNYQFSKVAKNESEMNTTSTDEFGEWNWNKERTKIFLKSSLGDNKFVIWNKQGKLSWSMEMETGATGVSESSTENDDKLVNLALQFDGAPAQIFSFIEYKSIPKQETIIETKKEIVYDNIYAIDSITGERNVVDKIARDSIYTVSYEKTVYDKSDEIIVNNTDDKHILFDYATYNRFMGTLDKRSDAILGQIKDKQMLMLQYKANGEEKFDMFMLEGLETLWDYLK